MVFRSVRSEIFIRTARQIGQSSFSSETFALDGSHSTPKGAHRIFDSLQSYKHSAPGGGMRTPTRPRYPAFPAIAHQASRTSTSTATCVSVEDMTNTISLNFENVVGLALITVFFDDGKGLTYQLENYKREHAATFLPVTVRWVEL
jgi:hypothetical protein